MDDTESKGAQQEQGLQRHHHHHQPSSSPPPRPPGGCDGDKKKTIDVNDPVVKVLLHEGAMNLQGYLECVCPRYYGFRNEKGPQYNYDGCLEFVTNVVKASNVATLEESPLRIGPMAYDSKSEDESRYNEEDWSGCWTKTAFRDSAVSFLRNENKFYGSCGWYWRNWQRKNEQARNGPEGEGEGTTTTTTASTPINFEDPVVKVLLHEGAKNVQQYFEASQRVESFQRTPLVYPYKACLALVRSVIHMSRVTKLEESPFRVGWVRTDPYLGEYWTNDDFKGIVRYYAARGEFGFGRLPPLAPPWGSFLSPCDHSEWLQSPVINLDDILTCVGSLSVDRLCLYGRFSSFTEDSGSLEQLKKVDLQCYPLPTFPVLPHVTSLRLASGKGIGPAPYRFGSLLSKSFPSLNDVSFVDETSPDTDVDFPTTVVDELSSGKLAFGKTLRNLSLMTAPDGESKITQDLLAEIILDVLPRFPDIEHVYLSGRLSGLVSLQPVTQTMKNRGITDLKKVKLTIILSMLAPTLREKLKRGDQAEVDALCQLLDANVEAKTKVAHGGTIPENIASLHPKIQYHLAINATGRLAFPKDATVKNTRGNEITGKKPILSPDSKEDLLMPCILERIGLYASEKKTKGGHFLKEPESGIFYALRAVIEPSNRCRSQGRRKNEIHEVSISSSVRSRKADVLQMKVGVDCPKKSADSRNPVRFELWQFAFGMRHNVE